MKKIAVLFGGRSVEHEVSVITGLQVLENMDRTRFEPIPIFIDKSGNWMTGPELFDFATFREGKLNKLTRVSFGSTAGDRNLYSISKGGFPPFFGGSKIIAEIDAVFFALHGTHGEDGTVQGLVELIDMPYTGGGVLASSVGMDKIMMKAVFKDAGLPMVSYVWFYRDAYEKEPERHADTVEQTLGYPVFVKPANLGSSIGITKASDRGQLDEALRIASNYDRKILVEKSAERPREINCSVIGINDRVRVSLCEEPVGWQDILSFEDKYVGEGKAKTKTGKGSSKRIIPAPIPDELRVEIETLAIKAFKAIDCRGIARIDFLVTPTNTVYVNEINTMPGSVAYYLWQPAGLPFAALISELLDIAFAAAEEKKKNLYSYDVDLYKKVTYGKGK